MKRFKVTLAKLISTTVEIKAESADAAQEEAMYQLMRGIIELEGGYAHDDVKAIVEEITAPESIPIYWDDLTESKQEEILAAFGDDCNYDTFPIVEIPVPEETEENE